MSFLKILSFFVLISISILNLQGMKGSYNPVNTHHIMKKISENEDKLVCILKNDDVDQLKEFLEDLLENRFDLELINLVGCWHSHGTFPVFFDGTQLDMNFNFFQLASYFGSVKCLLYLISLGFYMRELKGFNLTLLHILLTNNTNPRLYDVVKILLDHGAYVNYNGLHNNESPLCIALKNDAPLDVIYLLLDYGAYANQLTKEKLRTVPFFIKNREVAYILVSHGAQLDVTDINGVSALEYLIKKNILSLEPNPETYNLGDLNEIEKLSDIHSEDINEEIDVYIKVTELHDNPCAEEKLLELESDFAIKVLFKMVSNIDGFLCADIKIFENEHKTFQTFFELLKKIVKNSDEKLAENIALLLRVAGGPYTRFYYEGRNINLVDLLKISGYEKSLEALKKECKVNSSYSYFFGD